MNQPRTTPKINPKSNKNNKIRNNKNKSDPRKDVLRWIKEFVEVPHPVFADLPPCPYARQARLRGKVEFVELLSDQSDSHIHDLIDKFDTDKKDVLIIIADPERWTGRQTKQLGVKLNSIYKKRDLVIMEDHPDIVEKVKNIKLNNGKYILLLVQSRTKLKKFEDKLRQTEYYKNWSKSHLESVTGAWRHPLKPRS